MAELLVVILSIEAILLTVVARPWIIDYMDLAPNRCAGEFFSKSMSKYNE
jgi:hypothetical protein